MEPDLPHILMVAAMGLAPGVFWLWFFARKDRIEPEPAGYLAAMYFWGMLSVVPALAIQIPVSWLLDGSRFEDPVQGVLVAPLSEESLKLAFLLMALRFSSGLRKELDEPLDGIVYAAAVALGFASVENVGYLLGAAFAGELTTVFCLRFLLSVPGHVLFSAIFGYALGMTRCAHPPRKRKALSVLAGLALAVGAHAAFNGLASLNPYWNLVLLSILVFGFWIVLHHTIRSAREASPHGWSS